MIEVVEIKGDEYICICPFHDDNNPSLFINFEKNKAHCFAGCYAGSAIGLISKVTSWSKVKSEKEGKDFLYLLKEKPKVFEIEHLDTSVIFDNGLKYLKKRGFTEETIDLWDIIYDDSRKQVAIPIKNRKDELLGMIYRTIIPEVKPKYKYSSGTNVSHILFGSNMFVNDKNKVFLVEGSLDCIWLWQCGFKNTVAVLGCNISQVQMKLLPFLGNEIILCFDNDEPGQKAIKKSWRILSENGYNKIRTIKLPKEVKDVQELDKERLSIVLNEAKYYLKGLKLGNK